MQGNGADATPEVVDAVLRASRVLVSVSARSLAGVDHDVTLPQYRALVVLASRGAQRPGDLAEALGSHPSTVTRLCDRLVAKGLVSRDTSPTNRREVTIVLTGKGRRLVDRVTAKRRGELSAIVSRIRPEERATMVRALHSLGEAAGSRPTPDGSKGDGMRFHETTDRFRGFARRSRDAVLLAAITGALTGLGVALFERAVEVGIFAHLLDLSPWLLAFMPLCGLVLAWLALRFVAGNESPATADAYLQAFHDPERPLRLREAPGRMLAAIATLGFGGTMGLEGPSLYLGASIGAFLQRRFRWATEGSSTRLLLVAGAAAGVAAIFKAPATGAVFALEVPYQEDLARRMLLPALVSSASGYLAFVAVNGTAPLLSVRGTAPFSFADLAGAVALGVAAGVCARGFALLLRRAKSLTTSSAPMFRILGAGLAMAGIYATAQALTGEPIGIGVGYETIAWSLAAERALWLLGVILILRCLGTAATVAGGGVGGLFIPLVVAGALLGRITAETIGDPKSTLFVVIGVAAFLGAGYRVPLAAVMFVAEASGRPGFVVPALLAAVAASLVMGNSSVTAYQRPNLAGAPPESGGEPSRE